MNLKNHNINMDLKFYQPPGRSDIPAFTPAH